MCTGKQFREAGLEGSLEEVAGNVQMAGRAQQIIIHILGCQGADQAGVGQDGTVAAVVQDDAQVLAGLGFDTMLGKVEIQRSKTLFTWIALQNQHPVSYTIVNYISDNFKCFSFQVVDMNRNNSISCCIIGPRMLHPCKNHTPEDTA